MVAYSAEFAQVGGFTGTTTPSSSPVHILEEKRHVLCEKCRSITKLNLVTAVQLPKVIMKVNPKEPEIPTKPSIIEEKIIVFFPFNKYIPKKGGDVISKLDTSYISSIEKVEIKGFTCDVGTLKQNNELALKRAQVISQKLQEAGVSKERILSVEGLGKCCYKDSPAESRRVEITIKRKNI